MGKDGNFKIKELTDLIMSSDCAFKGDKEQVGEPYSINYLQYPAHYVTLRF